jgi:hypothetical protein
LMPKCRGTKPDGSQCTQTVEPPHRYCWWHDPANSEKRQRAAAKGGKAKVSKVIKGLHELLEDLTRRVVDGELETSRGAVANQLIGTRIRLLEHERRVRELEELEERLEALEAASERALGSYGGRRHG